MGFLEKLLPKKRIESGYKNNKKNDIYQELGILRPFTALENDQLRSFISDLSDNKKISETEKEAFSKLWYTVCPDFDGFGNNIWNLKDGNYIVYKKDDIEVQYEKKTEDIDKYYNEGRANFTYKSSSGNFIINQNERNKLIFLIYVSEDISDRLLSILREAEADVLKLKKDNIQEKYKVNVPKIDIKEQQLEIEKIDENEIGDK